MFKIAVVGTGIIGVDHIKAILEVEDAYLCALCSLAMPLGLNTIVIPSALGKDTTDAAGMAVISHLLSAISIPLIFMLV